MVAELTPTKPPMFRFPLEIVEVLTSNFTFSTIELLTKPELLPVIPPIATACSLIGVIVTIPSELTTQFETVP